MIPPFGGSSPSGGATLLGCSVMAITTGFELVNLGSIPSTPTKFYRHSIMNNTLRYERGNRGLIPFGGTNCFNVSGTKSDFTTLYAGVNV